MSVSPETAPSDVDPAPSEVDPTLEAAELEGSGADEAQTDIETGEPARGAEAAR